MPELRSRNFGISRSLPDLQELLHFTLRIIEKLLYHFILYTRVILSIAKNLKTTNDAIRFFTSFRMTLILDL